MSKIYKKCLENIQKVPKKDKKHMRGSKNTKKYQKLKKNTKKIQKKYMKTT